MIVLTSFRGKSVQRACKEVLQRGFTATTGQRNDLAWIDAASRGRYLP